MGWNNPPVPWRDLARALSGALPPGDHGDSPAWGRRREGYQRPERVAPPRSDLEVARARVPYAELHCHSNFSFLDGANHPEELVEEASRLGLDAIALTDHDGMYGVVRFAEAAKELGVATVFGTELSFGLSGPQNGDADPEGAHLLLLARGADGYRSLCRAITAGQMRGHDGRAEPGQHAEKGRPVYRLREVAEEVAGQCAVLTGCRKGSVRTALVTQGPTAAAARLRELVELFGRDNVYVELTDLGLPLDDTHNDLLARLARDFHLPTVATTAAHYAWPERGALADALAAIRARRSIEELEPWLPPDSMAFLRSGAEMAEIFERYPGSVQRSALLGRECAFELHHLEPKLPPFDLPDGRTEAEHLRVLTLEGAKEHFGGKPHEERAHQQLEHELKIIEELDFPGYFLIVHDIVEFCRRSDILCQGRGSAANSAVCYALGITKIDPVLYELLFERFLAPDRDGYPDIDLDIESDRREEAIQHVYTKYGRLNTAQVANVITYRARSAIRDAARALGYSPGQQDAWGKQIDRWGSLRSTEKDHEHDIPEDVVQLAFALEDFPRHLGIHSGGMVICREPVSQICPVEWARMPGRSVVQWEKEDCASAGLVKFDLLGLGMLSALHYMLDLVRDHKGVRVDLADLDLTDQKVYDMLCRADAIGVFQVESRAQLATLPRLRPRKFYDLAVEVALIRPGPIQGGSVHPYIRRKQGREEWDYDHPLLEKALYKTEGVPLFQEQMMQIALDVGGFTAAEADQLRHAMGSKRSTRKMERLRQRFLDGAVAKGVRPELAEQIFLKLKAFANFGFPESHALSFAHIVFSSAYFKHYHPDAFCAGLLRAQPMGFYSPQSLVADARRHGVTVLGPDINLSLPHATLEPRPDGGELRAVRNGIGTVRAVGTAVAEQIVAEREENGPYASMSDLARRVRLTTPQLEALATAGAFAGFGPDRRQALWSAGAAAQDRPEKLPGTGAGVDAPTLPGLDALDVAAADVWATGLSPDSYPTQFVRDRLDALGVVIADRLPELEDGDHVLVGGAVTHRQRPATAGGVTFINLEDETGMVNVICTLGLWQRFHRVARSSSALLVHGVLEKSDGVASVRALKLEPLPLRITAKSRDFR
ncbi:error-prone DNA polymerase [Amycolatopsis sp. PS_44_ISF1]|uniref:error-prone DNA polymerase n=1 Tax=Amycolatopsis sp. PS_44_ISF1 TaxID=2974917 RepID=UPI0028DDA485|nr:error-prone DNA polymerase [Amycolatopsis sp. PS_44_ISF1]MDT8909621.1 error-prone DNA polymerase [Amycolatopsis sp. PS_44_ISF1]